MARCRGRDSRPDGRAETAARPDQPVPVFNGDDLARLGRACAGRSFQQRRDAAVIAVFRATGMRLSELAGIRYDPDEPRRSDIDLRGREITVSVPGTPRPAGRSCGSAPATAAR